MPKNATELKSWWLDRVREPSTYQGLSMLAGVIGQTFFGSSEVGTQALAIGVAVAGLIGVGKSEAVAGRDY